MANDRIYFGAGIDWPLEQTAERAQLLESLGFDFLSTGEHVMQGSPHRPSTMVVPVLAAAAGATRRIRLLASVVLLPLYHPVLLAKLLAILDNVSAGRLIVGVGVGGEYPEEFEALGVPVEERGARADESLELLRRLWTGEPVTYEGRFWNVRGVALVPPPVQKPLPPIWVAGRRPAAMRRAARFGDGWYPHLYSPQRLQKSIEKIR